MKKKQAKPRAEKIETEDLDDSMADSYEELAVFFDEEDPLSLVPLACATSARALSNP